MFFPWIGLFEQIKLADIYVHLDDAQFPQGRSFMNRVQIKSPHDIQWLTVPVKRKGIQPINEVIMEYDHIWRDKHLKTLKTNYSRAPYFQEMFELINSIYNEPIELLSELNILAIEKISKYFGLNTKFVRSSELGITTKSSERLLQIIEEFDGDMYITGHGARNYINHELFENHNVKIEYMDYKRTAYPQLFGAFNPHVSILDLLSNTGKDGVIYIDSGTKNWKEFIKNE
ncbi:WbqC family protein [Paenibacillus aestuarii]|uniref:WbqC family protein n=1 Tax=Paenibacillus aestuarii TaxID=516965 RepID=A0ABW0K629_9BACL|nr:WbqC family protein [Paenibacillus aestuarii]